MENNKQTYVGETLSLHCQDGELNIWHGDIDDQRLLVMDIEQLYKDLPHIISLVVEEQKKMQAMYLNEIKESIKQLEL
tara:strand:- start:6216 stop:6449 length:234 start_codon:yes stop_codon:yes gene_type:complete